MRVKTYFETDNFTTRRTTGHNMLDPESLITGDELARGFTYQNSHRDYPGQATYDAIVSGDVSVTLVPLVAPRVFNTIPLNDTRRDAFAAEVRQARFVGTFAEYVGQQCSI